MSCRDLEKLLGELGLSALAIDPDAQDHLENCADCARLVETLGALDAELEALPGHEPSAKLIDETLAAVLADLPASPVSPDTRKTEVLHRLSTFKRWHELMAAAAVAVIAIGLTLSGRLGQIDKIHRPEAVVFTETGRRESESAIELFEPGQELRAPLDQSEQLNELKHQTGADEPTRQQVPTLNSAVLPEPGEIASPNWFKANASYDDARLTDANSDIASIVLDPAKGQTLSNAHSAGDGLSESSSAHSGETRRNLLDSDDLLGIRPASRAGKSDYEELTHGLGRFGPLAGTFLQERSRVTGLGFLDPHGYWKNTYLPGDPELRLLAARLGSSGTAPHHLAQQAEQPFDPPMKGALNLDLATDKTGIAGPTRMLLQIGLQATQRAAGRRPAMNLALVLDLDGLPSAAAGARMRALAEALAESWEIGDRFALIVAGRSGGVAVPPGAFRHGTVAVTMGDLLSGEALEGPSWDITQAYQEALALIATGDDPTAPLGSSGVLLVTADGFGDQLQRLAVIAHNAAVNGLPTSAVAVDPVVDPAELDSIALSGQGNRFLLERAAQASQLVERQLSAVAQVVARALRLNLRLAPGVQLVEVIGSEKLDERRAERVREVEQSIDQRLSRNLGIAADRGLDDDGIQIVIPSFYAGDSHVILLDLVVEGPGPIAEVSLKFKDLVGLGNGVIRDQISLGWEETELSPRELNVTRNLLVQQLSDTLETAADEMLYGQVEPARQRIAEHRQLLIELGNTLPGLAGDEALRADLELVGGYLSSLEELPTLQNGRELIDSMNYAAQSRLIQVQGLD